MKRAGLAALGRAGIAAAFGLATSVLVPIACGVDTQPPAPPQLTTGTSSAGPDSGSGGQGAGGASGTSVSSGSGPASVCECAAASFTPSSPCADCFHEVSGVDCAGPVTAFQKDPDSMKLLVALAGCDADAQCIADTLATHPGRDAYLDVLACVCVSCAGSCAAPSSVGCDAGKIPVEAGSDAGDAGDEAASDGGDAGEEDAADAGEMG